MKPSSLISKASVPLSRPMLIVRLNKPPIPGVQNTQIPSVVNVPLPDRAGLESVMSKISEALSGVDDNAQSATSGRRNRITHLTFAGTLAHLVSPVNTEEIYAISGPAITASSSAERNPLVRPPDCTAGS